MDINAYANRSNLLWESIESYFLSTRRDSRLAAYEDAARGLVEALKDVSHRLLFYSTNVLIQAKDRGRNIENFRSSDRQQLE